MGLTSEQLKNRYDALRTIGMKPIASLDYRDGIWKYWAADGRWYSIYDAHVEAILEQHAREWWLKRKRYIGSIDISSEIVTARWIKRNKAGDPEEPVFDHVSAETVIDAIFSAEEKEKDEEDKEDKEEVCK